jgi:uncharacterized protein (TIGR02466 family)
MDKSLPRYNFYYWGPLLFKINLRDEDLKKCIKLCSKKTAPANKILAGFIKNEYHINHLEYQRILDPYLISFRQAYRQWHGIFLTKKIVTLQAWVNFMVAGEFNPPHIHNDCDFSSVLFIKIPEKLAEERKKFPGTGAGPGAISFQYGESQPFLISEKSFLPEEGNLFIFPAMLSHFVSPFTSEGERISISSNFRLD